MTLIWLRRELPQMADRDLLALLPDTRFRDASSLDDLSRLLAEGDAGAVLASGAWSTSELIAAYEMALAHREIPFLVRLHAEPDAHPEDAVVTGLVRQAVALAEAGVRRVLASDTAAVTLAAEIREAAREHQEQALTRQAAAATAASAHWRRSLIGSSRAMFAVFQMVELVGQRRSTVLIRGETGTGKEMVARAIHAAGPRSKKPMVAVNCTALPDTLLEAELFGHTKGAFTGAVAPRTGRFEEAHQGTIFLDEIGDMPLDLQAKLLRVLQEREIQRIGSSETVPVDVRVLAATNVNLQQRVAEGKFREDLYYRLNVVPILLPPLRERVSDIPLLTENFIEKVCRLEDLDPKKVLQEAMHHLCTYDWPGNVRQLENTVEMAVVLSGERKVLLPGDFRLPRRAGLASVPTPDQSSPSLPDDGLDFEATVSALERALLRQALERTQGNKRMAAELLRLKRTTLTAKLKSLALAS